MADPTEFEIDGTPFKLNPLGVEAQLRVLTLITPLLASLRKGAPLSDALAALENMTPLYKVFERATKVRGVRGKDDKAWVDLSAFGDTVFARKPTLLIAFLAECVTTELGDFLAESGQARLTSLVSRFGSRKESTGGSGE